MEKKHKIKRNKRNQTQCGQVKRRSDGECFFAVCLVALRNSVSNWSKKKQVFLFVGVCETRFLSSFDFGMLSAVSAMYKWMVYYECEAD